MRGMLTLVHVGRFEGEKEGQETGWDVQSQLERPTDSQLCCRRQHHTVELSRPRRALRRLQT